jgi:hypothetical protein
MSVAIDLYDRDELEAAHAVSGIWARVNGGPPPTLPCAPCPLVSDVPAEDARETTWWRAMAKNEHRIQTIPAAPMPLFTEEEQS